MMTNHFLSVCGKDKARSTYWLNASGLFPQVIGCLFVAILCSCVSSAAYGEGCLCKRCACKNAKKVCRLVCEDKSVEVVCWGCQDEDFCLPGHSKERCSHCELVCGDCEENQGVQTKPHKFAWSEWMPCGPPQMHTRRKLMKRVVKEKVPSYKWVVEDLCGECQASLALPESPPIAAVPPLPPIDAETTVLLATHTEPDAQEGIEFQFEFDSGLSGP